MASPLAPARFLLFSVVHSLTAMIAACRATTTSVHVIHDKGNGSVERTHTHNTQHTSSVACEFCLSHLLLRRTPVPFEEEETSVHRRAFAKTIPRTSGAWGRQSSGKRPLAQSSGARYCSIAEAAYLPRGAVYGTEAKMRTIPQLSTAEHCEGTQDTVYCFHDDLPGSSLTNGRFLPQHLSQASCPCVVNWNTNSSRGG